MNIMRKDTPFKVKRKNKIPDLIVIHHIGSDKGKLYNYKGTVTWFTDESVHKDPKTGKLINLASAHYIVPRNIIQEKNGDIYNCIQFAEDNYVTYHAGISSYVINNKKISGINNYSIGIELEGDGNLIEYTSYQYEVLKDIIRPKLDHYGLDTSDIVGHEDVSPGRKVDPGKAFDWKRLRLSLEPKIIILPPEPKIPEINVKPGIFDNIKNLFSRNWFSNSNI